MVLHPIKQAQWIQVSCPQEPSGLLCYRLPAVTYNHYVVERIGWVHHKVIVTEVIVKILLVHACAYGKLLNVWLHATLNYFFKGY